MFNHIRWQSRWKHYERFAKHVADAGGVLYTVEVAFGERDHATGHPARDGQVAKCNFREDMIKEHRWITLRTDQEVWHKEAAINAGVRFLPNDWKYVAWIDGDVDFARPNWVGETIHQLQHYKFLQMFGFAQDLDPDYEPLTGKPGFIKAYQNHSLEELTRIAKDYYYSVKPGLGAWSGLAWACTREAWDAVGGLMDFPITGAADWYMAWALIGEVEKYIPKGSHIRFTEAIMDWQDLAEQHIRRNVGHMTGLINHYFHGRKKDRKYVDRSLLLSDYQFDPSKDIKKDWQGLYLLNDDGSDRFRGLRDGIMTWFRQRNEDSTEV